jgi:hypothetical protein
VVDHGHCIVIWAMGTSYSVWGNGRPKASMSHVLFRGVRGIVNAAAVC